MHPEVVLNSKMGNVYTPATMNFWRKDLFIHITFADVFSGMSMDDYMPLSQVEIKQGDSIMFPAYQLKLDTLLIEYTGEKTDFSSLKILAPVTAFTRSEIMLRDTLVYEIANGLVERKDVVNPKSGHKYVFSGVSDTPQTISLQVLEPRMDFIVVKAREFPLIWLVWLGAITMFAGVIVALFRRMAAGRKHT
jgi:cytochrome c biogenesis factor